MAPMDEDFDFAEYLAKYGNDENDDSNEEDEDDKKEREAELYSRLHYDDAIKLDPDLKPPCLNENLSLDLYKELITSSSNSKTLEDKLQSQQPEISKYQQANQELNSRNRELNSEDSEDDSGIQIVQEKVQSPSRKRQVIEINESDSEASEVEIEPSWKKKKKIKATQQLKIEHEEMKGKKFKHYIADQIDSDSSQDDSSVQEIESDVEIQDLHLNVKGSLRTQERSFQQVIGQQQQQDKAGNEPKLVHKWTEDMEAFYNEVNPEFVNITLDDIMRDLPDDADWSVRRPHATPSRSNNRYFYGKFCRNCCKNGHETTACPEPRRRIFCIMCLEEGHFYNQCPHQHCLRCGNFGEPYTTQCRKCRYLDTMVCRLCGGRGHIQSHCADHWRRYHATTSPQQSGPRVPPEDTHLATNRVWCCNCARQVKYTLYFLPNFLKSI